MLGSFIVYLTAAWRSCWRFWLTFPFCPTFLLGGMPPFATSYGRCGGFFPPRLGSCAWRGPRLAFPPLVCDPLAAGSVAPRGVSGDLGVTVPALSGAAPGFSGPGGRWARPRPSAGFADSRPNQAPIRPKPGADSRLNQALIRAQTWRGFAP